MADRARAMTDLGRGHRFLAKLNAVNEIAMVAGAAAEMDFVWTDGRLQNPRIARLDLWIVHVDEDPPFVPFELQAARFLRRTDHLQSVIVDVDEDVIHEGVEQARFVPRSLGDVLHRAGVILVRTEL